MPWPPRPTAANRRGESRPRRGGRGTRLLALRWAWAAALALAFPGVAIAQADPPAPATLPAIPAPTTPAPTAAVPAEAELRRLVTDTLLGWNQAVRQGDFTAFHATCAAPLREQATPQALRKAFGDFIARKADLAGIAQVAPHFDAAPAVDEDGVLSVRGHFPTTPAEVRFDLRFLEEGGAWKPLGARVEARPAGAVDDAEARALARRTLAEFAAAVPGGEFAALRAGGSAPFRAQQTTDRLRAAFAGFLRPPAPDLSALREAEVTLAAPPSLEAGPVLVVAGHCPLPGGRAAFTLTYLGEQGQWRLLAIEVSVGRGSSR